MNRLILILTIISIAAVCTAVQYPIPYLSVPANIDGSIGQAEWQDALYIPMYYPDVATVVNNAPVDNADLSTDIYVKWDNDYLYIAARVYDQNLQWLQYAPGPFNNQDAFQVCFNPNKNPASVLFDNAPIYDIVPQDAGGNGAQFYKHDGSNMSLPNALMSAQILADGYSVEIAMPWSELGVSPLAGQMHGIGFIVVDYDGGTSADTLMYDFTGAITAIGNWNTAILVGENGCGQNGIYPADLNHDCVVDLKDFAIIAQNWLICTNPEFVDCVNLN